MVCRHACRRIRAALADWRAPIRADRQARRARLRRPVEGRRARRASADRDRPAPRPRARRDLEPRAGRRRVAPPLHPRVSWRGAAVVTTAPCRTKGRSMERQQRPLRRGWTTGTSAAAAKAAFAALLTGEFPDPVEVTLPRGERPSFALALTRKDDGSATAGVIKDAGDDPDVTHGALVLATVRAGTPGTGVTFRAGEGVGLVTRAGLPIPPGEPAINPVPRRMIRD